MAISAITNNNVIHLPTRISTQNINLILEHTHLRNTT